jgi:hypothetical protein
MEFHFGIQDIPAILENAGYRIDVIDGKKSVGYIYAEKLHSESPYNNA